MAGAKRLIPVLSPRLTERFWRCVEKGPGCWRWMGRAYGRGYGRFSGDRRELGAHQASWLVHFGPIAPGMCVLHRCDNPNCVNPDHLFLGTDGDNVRDCASKGRHSNGRARLTQCHNGHPFDEKNTRTNQWGRVCRKCALASKSRYRARQRLARRAA